MTDPPRSQTLTTKCSHNYPLLACLSDRSFGVKGFLWVFFIVYGYNSRVSLLAFVPV